MTCRTILATTKQMRRPKRQSRTNLRTSRCIRRFTSSTPTSCSPSGLRAGFLRRCPRQSSFGASSNEQGRLHRDLPRPKQATTSNGTTPSRGGCATGAGVRRRMPGHPLTRGDVCLSILAYPTSSSRDRGQVTKCGPELLLRGLPYWRASSAELSRSTGFATLQILATLSIAAKVSTSSERESIQTREKTSSGGFLTTVGRSTSPPVTRAASSRPQPLRRARQPPPRVLRQRSRRLRPSRRRWVALPRCIQFASCLSCLSHQMCLLRILISRSNTEGRSHGQIHPWPVAGVASV